MTHGASLTTMSTTSTTLERTTCPSQNCGSAACIIVNGYPYVDMFDALNVNKEDPKVIEKYRHTPFNDEFRREFDEFKATIESMKLYDFTEEKFKPGSAERRLGAVMKVLDHGEGGP